MSQRDHPAIVRDDPLMRSVTGSFFRAVDPAYRDVALAGSRSAGRYSPPGVPTLYLSASPEGVAAAMIAHTDDRIPNLRVLQFEVDADRIVDLRDHEALTAVGIDPADAATDWQKTVAAGGSPSSWRLRDALQSLGAHGLIDPSRK